MNSLDFAEEDEDAMKDDEGDGDGGGMRGWASKVQGLAVVAAAQGHHSILSLSPTRGRQTQRHLVQIS